MFSSTIQCSLNSILYGLFCPSRFVQALVYHLPSSFNPLIYPPPPFIDELVCYCPYSCISHGVCTSLKLPKKRLHQPYTFLYFLFQSFFRCQYFLVPLFQRIYQHTRPSPSSVHYAI